MCELIVCKAVKFKVMHGFSQISAEFCVKAGCVHRTLTAHRKLKLKSGKTCLYRLFTEPVKSFFGIFNAAKASYKVVKVIYHIHRFSVNFIIRRMCKIIVYGSVNYCFKSCYVNSSVPYRHIHFRCSLVPY